MRPPFPPLAMLLVAGCLPQPHPVVGRLCDADHACGEGLGCVAGVCKEDPCGGCTAPQVCGGGGTPGVCGAPGTGAHHGVSHVADVTGGGAMPDWSRDVVVAECAGDGVTNDTSCLQAAADRARDEGKALVIPYTPAFYKVTDWIGVSTSVAGVGGMPTIKQTREVATSHGVGLHVEHGTKGWIYNLHLVGTFTGEPNPAMTDEIAHNLELGCVAGVTVAGNLLEGAYGEGIGTNFIGACYPGKASNVLIDNNTIRGPFSHGIGFVQSLSGFAVTNNVIEKQYNHNSGIGFVPFGTISGVLNVEIAYNEFAMNTRTPVNPNHGLDGRAVHAWVPADVPNPGGNYYVHHNYGTFGVGFGEIAGPGFFNVNESDNYEGSGPPP